MDVAASGERNYERDRENTYKRRETRLPSLKAIGQQQCESTPIWILVGFRMKSERVGRFRTEREKSTQ
jgi:hypothetical protein